MESTIISNNNIYITSTLSPVKRLKQLQQLEEEEGSFLCLSLKSHSVTKCCQSCSGQVLLTFSLPDVCRITTLPWITFSLMRTCFNAIFVVFRSNCSKGLPCRERLKAFWGRKFPDIFPTKWLDSKHLSISLFSAQIPVIVDACVRHVFVSLLRVYRLHCIKSDETDGQSNCADILCSTKEGTGNTK